MKVGLLGTRHVHAETLIECAEHCGAQIIGASEENEQAAQLWTRTPLVERQALLETCDHLIVAGTNRERTADIIAACDHGIRVLAEKPVAITEHELQMLLEHDSTHELVSMALPVRFSRSMRQARRAVLDGILGTPIAARGTNHGQFPGSWFGSLSDSGGGALQDHVVHLSDGLCWLLDDKATHVYARALQRLYPDNDVEDCAIITLDFASGLFASIDASWSRPCSFPTWGDVWLEVVGTKGRIRIDPMITHIEFYDDQQRKLRHLPYSDDDMTLSMVRGFLGADDTERVPLADAIHASDTVLAAYSSLESGRLEPITHR